MLGLETCFKGEVETILIDQREIAESQLLLFNLAWEQIAKSPKI